MSVIRTSKRGGVCAYCKKKFPKLTKEHVVPKCFGGVYTIRVCENCNNERGSELNDPRFVQWRREHPKEFAEAVRESTDPKQTQIWLEQRSKAV